MSKQEPSNANKWADFHKMQTSTMDLKSPSVQVGDTHHSYVEDFKREAEPVGCRMFVNGKPLSDIAKGYNNFHTRADIDDFIDKVLLKDMPQKDMGNKVSASNYLRSTLHQGGLLFPVTSALPRAIPFFRNDGAIQDAKSQEIIVRDLPAVYNKNSDITDDEKKKYYAPLISPDTSIEQKINIVTTPVGIKIQETVRYNTVNVAAGPLHSREDINIPEKIKPSRGELAVLSAEATIDIDFSENPSAPEISIESNKIHFGHPVVKQHMDKRSFLDVLVDFIKNILGQNKYSAIHRTEKPEARIATDVEPTDESTTTSTFGH